MPLWSADDAFNDKPLFPLERTVRQANSAIPIQLTVLNTVIGTGPGNNTVTFVGTGPNTAANVGVIPGMYVYDTSGWNTISYMGDDPGLPGNHIEFFTSNNTVLSVSGNVVTLSSNVVSTVLSGNVIAFGTALNRGNRAFSNTYNQDTILLTATRMSNVLVGTANVGNMNTGWNRIQKKVNNDGTVRYLKETLVALASPSASNVSSGNTSFGGFVSGL